MPKLRNSYATADAADSLSKALTGWLNATSPTELWRSCATCLHMRHGKQPAHCSKYNMVPPASVIVGATDCGAYEDNEDIPF
jgi:hypothetical protein